MMLLSYLDSALLLALLLTTVIKRLRVFCNLQGVAIVVGMLLPVVLIGDLPIYQYLRALIADLSITSKLLILTVLYQRFLHREAILRWTEFGRLRVAVALVGLAFYPLALGISMFDPYSYGYQATTVAVIVALLVMALIVRRYYWTGSVLAMALVAYYLGILESDNLWDYLLDPVLWLYCLTSVIFAWVRSALGFPPRTGESASEQTAPSCSV